jgi:hypothetical protein
MLRLPPNLLVMDQASVETYAKRAAAGGDAEFDFRGMRWFGRDRDISTSVSPLSFVQLRAAPPSAVNSAVPLPKPSHIFNLSYLKSKITPLAVLITA